MGGLSCVCCLLPLSRSIFQTAGTKEQCAGNAMMCSDLPVHVVMVQPIVFVILDAQLVRAAMQKLPEARVEAGYWVPHKGERLPTEPPHAHEKINK